MSFKQYIVLFALLLAVPPVARAQSAQTTAVPYDTLYTAPVAPLSLEECIARAVYFDTPTVSRSLDTLQAHIALQSAWHSFLPFVGASVSQDFNFGRSQDKRGVILDQSSANTSFGASASIDLFTGLKRIAELKAARLDKSRSIANLEQSTEEVTIRVIGLYYNLVLQTEVLQTNKLSIEQTRRTLEYTKHMVDAGKWAVSKLYEVEARLASDELALANAKGSLLLAQQALAQAIAYYAPTPIEVEKPSTDALIEEERMKIRPMDEVYREALANRPSYRATLLNTEIARLMVQSAQSGWYPSLSLRGGYSNGYYLPLDKEMRQLTPSFSDQMKQNGRYFVGLSLSIPLFDGLRTYDNVRRARLRTQYAEVERAAEARRLQQSVSEAHTNATTALLGIDAANKSVEAARKSYETMRIAFEAGQRTAVDLEQSQNKLHVAEVEALRAKYDFLYKTAILETMTRQPAPSSNNR